MGPVILFDKSFLQSLSVDESVWFDHFFYPNISPLFYVETLADLTKGIDCHGQTAEEQVKVIANKTPDLSGGPCVHHLHLCISNLLGKRIPMHGQIPIDGAKPIRSADGKIGVSYDASPESQAFSRWTNLGFSEVERRFAHDWREMLTRLDLPGVAKGMQSLGINSQTCKSVQEAFDIADSLVRSKNKPYDQIGLLFAFLDVPRELEPQIVKRWADEQYRPLAEFAPFAAHVFKVELFFQICIASNIISTGRASNRVDIAYLFYLPFCNVFTSSDKLHRKCSAPFLRPDQEFVWGQDLKAELRRQNEHFSSLPDIVRENGIMSFASHPFGDETSLIVRLWDTHFPNWRTRKDKSIELSPQDQKRLVQTVRRMRENTLPSIDTEELVSIEPTHIHMQRFAPQKKGNWWLLPKNLEKENDND